MNNNITLQDKFYGCIAACHIGSSMGAAVENLPYQQIEEKHGLLDELLSYEHYSNGWIREPGTTEDGVERQKLMINAIIDKQDRVNAEDVRKIWVRDIKTTAPGQVSEPFEAKLLQLASSVIPASDIGKYCDYAGLNSMARACHPIGLINAGNVKHAIEDVLEVGQLYQSANGRGLKWASVTVTAIAEATKRDATVDSVISAIYKNCDPNVVSQIDRELNRTKNCKDIRELRTIFDDVYNGKGMDYPNSYANEVVTKGVCIFKMVKGNTKDAIIAGVNMGRDTDCVAAVAGGISGALSGSSTILKKWIDQVDYATSLNIYTNTQRTIKETSDALYDAFVAMLEKNISYIAEMKY